LALYDSEEAAKLTSDAEAAKARAEAKEDQKALAAACYKLAYAKLLAGQPEEAMLKAQDVVDLAEICKLDVGRAAALCLMGRICAAYGTGQDDADLGFDSLEDATRQFRKLKSRRGEAIALWSSALLESALGKAPAAVTAANDCIAICKELQETQLHALALQALAKAHAASGDFRAASNASERAANARRRMGEEREAASCMHEMAKYVLQGGDLDRALALCEEAMAASEGAKDTLAVGAVMDSKVKIHVEAERLVEALEVAKAKVTYFHDCGDQKSEGRALLQVAAFMLEHDVAAPRQAQALAEHAIGLLSKVGDQEGVTLGYRLHGSGKISGMQQELDRVMELHAPYMHVPRHLFIEPEHNKLVKQHFGHTLRDGF